MIVRLIPGDDGESHFEDIDPSYERQGNTARTPIQSAQGVIFRQQDVGVVQDFHVAPRRQYIVNLSGHAEISVGGGEVRTFGPGDVLLAEDLTGRGHTIRVIGTETRVSMIIPL